MKFKITWPSLAEETVESSDETLDSFVNTHFGSAWDSAVESGVKVEVVEDAVPEDDHVE